MALVFQFGSNTSSHRLNGPDRLEGTAISLGLARTVAPHDLAFTAWSEGMQCAVADLRPGRGRTIYGVLWDIPDQRVFRDRAEGRTLDDVEHEGETYTRTTMPVCLDATGEAWDAWTYVVREPRLGLPTAARYVHHIFVGLREHLAPAEYIAYVKERVRASNPALATVIEDW